MEEIVDAGGDGVKRRLSPRAPSRVDVEQRQLGRFVVFPELRDAEPDQTNGATEHTTRARGRPIALRSSP